jgi:hypothetical protein
MIRSGAARSAYAVFAAISPRLPAWRLSTAVAIFLKGEPPVPAGGRDRRRYGNAHDRYCFSPSPQGHEQRRVSARPQAKFGRAPPHQKILTVVRAQH